MGPSVWCYQFQFPVRDEMSQAPQVGITYPPKTRLGVEEKLAKTGASLVFASLVHAGAYLAALNGSMRLASVKASSSKSQGQHRRGDCDNRCRRRYFCPMPESSAASAVGVTKCRTNS